MKKYAIILGLAVLATGAMAQNNVTLNQYSGYQMANIAQLSTGNNANVWQGAPSAIGSYADGNYAFLKQNGSVTADLIQFGKHNLIAVEQTYVTGMWNYVKIEQYKDNNIVAAYNPMESPHCGHPQIFNCDVPKWCPDPCQLGVPTPFGTINLQGYLTVYQDGGSNSFLVAGSILKGTTEIWQYGGSENKIWLKKEKEVGGYLAIAQNGNKNKVALDFATTGSGRITQTGNSNTVGRFSFGAHFTYGRPPHTETVLFDGLCENCPTDFADFKGDNLNIIQQGNNNKISLESTTANANVTISQFGNNNKARVYQGLAGNYTASIYIPCSGCQH